MKPGIVYVQILIYVLSVSLVYSVNSSEVSSLDNHKVTLSCRNTPLKDVVESVYKQTQVTIHVEDTLLTMPVTGKFNDVEIGAFFQRIFRGKNFSLLFSEKDKTCIIQTFGQKERKFYTTGKADQLDPFTHLKSSELAALHAEQRKSFQEYSQNPMSVDQLTGMTLGDINESQVKQRESFAEYSNNPDSFDPLVGKTIGDINKSHDRQREAFQAESENPESTDPLTGQKRLIIKKSHDLQREKFREYSNNPDSIDPLTGLTLGYIKNAHERQRREFSGK